MCVPVCLSICLSVHHARSWATICMSNHWCWCTDLMAYKTFYNLIIFWIKNSFFFKNEKNFVMFFSRSKSDRTFDSWQMSGCTQGLRLPTINFFNLWFLVKYYFFWWKVVYLTKTLSLMPKFHCAESTSERGRM